MFKGRQVQRGGDGPCADPLEQATRAAPQARRREGLAPNGRDDKDGTGRSQLSPAVQGTDTPGRSCSRRLAPCLNRSGPTWATLLQ
ncbi:hypothetical protein IPC150_01330 [Pseudomonas aeruginosa]|nr:hypothetical protein F3K36_11825 [Delftia sp. BR1]MCO2824795.1 hypothetical protein [Pseudomonas aeruginosa]MPT53638.1 hypothetical protein [Delftia sp.]QFS67645.1 hypothetical protein GCS91_26720 [Delftia tsuruhatensis]HBY34833.1 hypothetical protein [Delftia acidovorans]